MQWTIKKMEEHASLKESQEMKKHLTWSHKEWTPLLNKKRMNTPLFNTTRDEEPPSLNPQGLNTSSKSHKE